MLVMRSSALFDGLDDTKPFVITAKGEVKNVAPEDGKEFHLPELRKIVDGYIEVVYLQNGRYYLIVNEEGKLPHVAKPFNAIATYICVDNGGPGDGIVGDVLICAKRFVS